VHSRQESTCWSLTESIYWPAVSGQWAEKVGGGTSRDYGPCGVELDYDRSFLFSHPELDYDYYAPVKPEVEECLLTPFYVNGKAIGTIWIVMHDLSRRLDAEDLRLMTDLGAFAGSAFQAISSITETHAAAIIDSSDDAIVTKDLNSIITGWSVGAESIFGYSAAEAIGKSVTMLIPSDHEDEEPSILGRIRSGQRIEHYETVRVRKDGSLLDISLTVSPIRDFSGKIVGASKIARDITDRKRAGEQIKELAREAEHRATNILSNAGAIVQLTEAEDVSTFKKSVQGRIQAIANLIVYLSNHAGPARNWISLSPKNLNLTAGATARASVSTVPNCSLNQTRRKRWRSSVTNWQQMLPTVGNGRVAVTWTVNKSKLRPVLD
jgi:PAS domain S-box-containing protein